MTDVVDLEAERLKRDRPNKEFIAEDLFGRTMYAFLAEYKYDGQWHGISFFAYDADDAESRVKAMMASGGVELRGQMYREVE